MPWLYVFIYFFVFPDLVVLPHYPSLFQICIASFSSLSYGAIAPDACLAKAFPLSPVLQSFLLIFHPNSPFPPTSLSWPRGQIFKTLTTFLYLF